MIEFAGCKAESSPPVGLETHEVEGIDGVVGTEGVEEDGAAATKLVAAKRKAGINERTRIVNEWKERRVSKDWSDETKMRRNCEGKIKAIGCGFYTPPVRVMARVPIRMAPLKTVFVTLTKPKK